MTKTTLQPHGPSIIQAISGKLLPSVAYLSASQDIGLLSEALAGPGVISWFDFEPQSAKFRIKLLRR